MRYMDALITNCLHPLALPPVQGQALFLAPAKQIKSGA